MRFGLRLVSRPANSAVPATRIRSPIRTMPALYWSSAKGTTGASFHPPTGKVTE